MYLIKNAQLFSPKPLGVQDVLIINNKIIKVAKNIDENQSVFDNLVVIDAKEQILMPGLIDGHQHFTGGGGEGGYTTKVPEMSLSMNILNGVTTAVGLLGTDAISRNLENLYAKTEAFNENGLTAFMLTGSYWFPSPTITGSISKDIAFINSVIGVKLAIADHRGPYLTDDDIAKLVAEVRLASLISNKPGFITLHTGILEVGLTQIHRLVTEKEISPTLFLPTHINRRSLINACIELSQLGMMMDATARNDIVNDQGNAMNAAELVSLYEQKGLLDYLCVSSDAGGSLPRWNEDRTKMLGMGIGTPESLLFELQLLVEKYQLPLEKALQPFVTNPAKFYGLEHYKGKLEVGYEADLILLQKDQFKVQELFSKGRWMVKNGVAIQKDYFESI